MAKLITLDSSVTYATEANAIKAVEKKFGYEGANHLRYFIARNAEGRFFPVFIGTDALQHMVHFHFSVVA
jgi:hypothetical protein